MTAKILAPDNNVKIVSYIFLVHTMIESPILETIFSFFFKYVREADGII